MEIAEMRRIIEDLARKVQILQRDVRARSRSEDLEEDCKIPFDSHYEFSRKT